MPADKSNRKSAARKQRLTETIAALTVLQFAQSKETKLPPMRCSPYWTFSPKQRGQTLKLRSVVSLLSLISSPRHTVRATHPTLENKFATMQ
jgi:hypothetical protein